LDILKPHTFLTGNRIHFEEKTVDQVCSHWSRFYCTKPYNLFKRKLRHRWKRHQYR